MEQKSTLREPSKMGKKFVKNFNNQMYSQGAGELTEIDSMLQEKEQSLKKQIWDLAKMESLVHSDPKLSAKYNEMAETGEETYGYHYNETIMNILFNDYVLNSQSYLQKYKNAIPAEKKRRDKSGINQLQQKGEEKMKKSGDDKKEVDEQSYDKNYVNAMKADLKGQGENPSKVNNMTPKQLENKDGLFNEEVEIKFNGQDDWSRDSYVGNDGRIYVDVDGVIHSTTSEGEPIAPARNIKVVETTGAASGGAFTPALDFKTNRDIAENGDAVEAIRNKENAVDETTTSASSGAFVGPFGTKRHKKLDTPAWNGGTIIGENYLTDPAAFKGIFESYENEVVPSSDDRISEPVTEGVNPTQLKGLDTQFLQRILNSLFTTLDTTKQQSPEADNDIALIQQELRSRGVLKEPAQQKKGIMNKLGSMFKGEGVELDEHHLNSKAQKVDFIIQQTNKSGEPLSSRELMELPDETIDVMYKDIEKSMGMSEEKIETGPDSGIYSFTKEKEQFQKSAEAQPQPEIDIEAPKDVNEYSDLDKEVLSRSARKKLTLSQLLAWANENVLFNPNPQSALEAFAAEKRISLEQLRGVAEYYLENNLGYQGSVETAEQDVLVELVDTIDELTQVEEPVAEPQGDVEEASQTGVETSHQGLKANIAKLLSKLMPHMANDLNQLMDFTETTVKLFFNDDYSKAYNVIKAKVDDLGEGILSGDGQSMIGDNPTTMAATMKDVSAPSSFGEGINEDVKKCRKDEKPVPGKLPGEKGACEKKNKIDPKERKENKHNVDTRIQREKEKEKRLEKRTKKDDSDSDVLDKNDKQMKKLKEMTEGINEDKRPSALVQMDRLHKENEKNFKSDLKTSNTEDLKGKEDEMDALGQYSEVGDNPYELGEKIEKEKLAKIAKLEKEKSALKNVGDSTNDSDTEIPKRNLTAGELEQLNLDRGLGMQDIVYDNKPSKRFVDRMKNDMGEEIYDQAQKKMEYRKNAPMYNKDTQPVADGINKTQFNKNEEGFNDKKGIKTESVITGKYRDEFNKIKFVDFKINEAVEVKQSNGVLLNLAGLGNVYTQSVNENKEMRNIMNSFDFYLDKGAVVKVAKKQSLTESKETSKPAVNEQVEKMKKLFSYDPSKRVDTSNVKKNRGF